VLEFSHSYRYIGKLKKMWLCRCACGIERAVHIRDVIYGRSKSCGKGSCNHRSISSQSWNEYAYNQRYSLYKSSAIKRGKVFELSIEEFINMISSCCEYCGATPADTTHCRGKLKHNVPMNGVDRVDNSIGYVIENCKPCCAQCNRGKMAYSLDDFKSWIGRVYNKLYNEETH
jgi:hypothetical protein